MVLTRLSLSLKTDKPLIKKILLKFYLFGSLGFTTEILFTAVSDNFARFGLDLPLDLKLQGNSYIWMFFIYGLASFLVPIANKILSNYHLLMRVFLIALGIFAVEFITGFILDKTTGHCPWEYHTRWNVMGYIRLDYLPAWMFFAFILEEANMLFDKMLETF
jgi:uncharacterized membrane protein